MLQRNVPTEGGRQALVPRIGAQKSIARLLPVRGTGKTQQSGNWKKPVSAGAQETAVVRHACLTNETKNRKLSAEEEKTNELKWKQLMHSKKRNERNLS